MQTDTHQILQLFFTQNVPVTALKLLNNIKRVNIITEHIFLTGKHFIF